MDSFGGHPPTPRLGGHSPAPQFVHRGTPAAGAGGGAGGPAAGGGGSSVGVPAARFSAGGRARGGEPPAVSGEQPAGPLDSEALTSVAKLLAEAARPVIMAGAGVYWERAED